MYTLLKRFISREHNELPDIDFEPERREEVIQYLYKKYCRERAALTAVVISCSIKSALKDVGKPHLRPVVLGSRLRAEKGHWQRQGNVCSSIVGRLEDLTPMLAGLARKNWDFR